MSRAECLKLYAVFLLLILTTTFGYFNIGVGYNYGTLNNWALRIGYEDTGVSINADYTIEKVWNIIGGLYFSTEVGFEIGPMIYATYDFSQFTLMYGPALGIQNKQMLVQIGYLSDFTTFSNITDSIFINLRFYVPDPPGMRMTDKLYIEGQYHKGNFKVIIGLLEPYF